MLYALSPLVISRIVGIVGLFTWVSTSKAADPPTVISPTRVTLDFQNHNLSDVLNVIAKQSNVLVDTTHASTKTLISLKVKDAPFWEVLETLASKSGNKIAVSAKGSKIALVSVTALPEVKASLAGPFRFVAREIVARKDLETGQSYYEFKMEAHWEPHFPVFRTSGFTATATSDAAPKEDAITDAGKAPVTGYTQAFSVRLISVPRSATTVSVKGQVTVTAADKMLRFSFDDITKAPSEKTAGNVSAKLLRMKNDDGLWEAKMELAYPPGMPEFESFESFLTGNQCRLISPGRNKSFNPTDYEPPVDSSKPTITYRFKENAKTGLLPAAGWALEYETPSPLKQFQVSWSFEGVKLP